jgi:hypothetical protein
MIANGSGRGSHPMTLGFSGVMLLDVLEMIKKKTSSSGIKPRPILTIAGAFIQIATDFYPGTESAFNDLWYCVNQVKHLPLPELLPAYDILISLGAEAKGKEHLIERFTQDRTKLAEELAKGEAATTTGS